MVRAKDTKERMAGVERLHQFPQGALLPSPAIGVSLGDGKQPVGDAARQVLITSMTVWFFLKTLIWSFEFTILISKLWCWILKFRIFSVTIASGEIFYAWCAKLYVLLMVLWGFPCDLLEFTASPSHWIALNIVLFLPCVVSSHEDTGSCMSWAVFSLKL